MLKSSLRELRLAIGRRGKPLTQMELAEKLGTTQGHLSQVENGQRRATQFMLQRIADALDVKLEVAQSAAAETARRAKAQESQLRDDEFLAQSAR